MSKKEMAEAFASDKSSLDAAVIGAGFGGMYMLHKLRSMGLRVHGYERATDVGGTWYWNRYPGARCDVVSLDYSYGFSHEIQQEWNWSEKFAPQPEILAYARFVADRLDLRRDISFGVDIISLVYDDATKTWTVATASGEVVHTRFVVMATGCLSVPKAPEIPGVENFAGEVYFTSKWPHEKVSFAGKTVGLIGTGSSGIQVFPEIAKEADDVFVFQRTPSFTMPARNAPMTQEAMQTAKSSYAERRIAARNHPAGHLRPLTDRKTFSVGDAERRERFESAWQDGGLGIFGQFGDLLVDEVANKAIADMVFGKIDDIVHDPETAEKLKPRGYPFGGRRICFDTDYYETFNRDNVHLVDVVADPVERIAPEGVVTQSQTYALDALVLAVGFDAMTGALLAIDIRGRDGVSLRDKWRAGPASYLGVQIAGFPNLFTVTGPGSPSVLTNVITSIEQHVEWISALIDHMGKAGLCEVEATEEAEHDWVRYNYDLASNSLLMKANSWFLGANIPGKPRVFMPFAGGFVLYRDICDDVAAQNYRGFRFWNRAGDVAPA